MEPGGTELLAAFGKAEDPGVAHDTGCVPSHLSPTVNPKARRSRVFLLECVTLMSCHC